MPDSRDSSHDPQGRRRKRVSSSPLSDADADAEASPSQSPEVTVNAVGAPTMTAVTHIHRPQEGDARTQEAQARGKHLSHPEKRRRIDASDTLESPSQEHSPGGKGTQECTGLSPSRSAALAPVVGLLSAVSARVHAAWARIGVPRGARDCRWHAFLEQNLAPFIQDFLSVNEAEERSIAAENDQLLRDIFFLCERLRETCEHGGLEHVMNAIRHCTDHSHTHRVSDAHVADDTDKVSREADSGDNHDDARKGGSGSDSSISGGSDERSTRDLLMMPDFTSFFLTSASVAEGRERKEEECSTGAKIGRKMNAVGERETHSKEAKGDDEKVTTTTTAPPRAIQAAIRQLTAEATHQEVQTLLHREYARLDALADYRMWLLCVLLKQRALLRLPAGEQAALRAQYAAKYLQQRCLHDPAFTMPLSTASEAPTSTVAARSSAVSSSSSSGNNSNVTARSYHSALSSARLSTDAGSKGAAAAADGSHDGHAAVTMNVAAPAKANGRENGSDNKEEEELHLFLETSLITDSVEFRGTSFCLQPRPTAATLAIVGKDQAGSPNQRAGAQQRQDVAAAEPTAKVAQPQPQPRATILDVDTSDVMQFGKRQDLSMTRIKYEANEIVRQIQEQNATMEQQAQSELTCVRDLFATAVASGLFGSANRDLASVASTAASDDKATRNGSMFSGTIGDRQTLPFQLADVEAQLHDLHNAFMAPECDNTANNSNDYDNKSKTTSVIHQARKPETVSLAAQASLPPAVRRTFTIRSYAPVLNAIMRARIELQSAVWSAHRVAVTTVLRSLAEARAAYQRATGEAASVNSSAAAETASWDLNHAAFEVSSSTADASLEASMAALAKHLSAARALITRAQPQLHALSARLALLARAAPLVASHHAILAEQRALQVGSRERLLDKRVNMAKQLLHEEGVRRRIAKELPRVVRELKEIEADWDALAASDHDAPASPSTPVQSTVELRVGGQSVSALLRQYAESSHADKRSENRLRSGRVHYLSRSRTPPTATATTGTTAAPGDAVRDPRRPVAPQSAISSRSATPPPLTPYQQSARAAGGVRSVSPIPLRPRSPPSQLEPASRAMISRPQSVSAAIASAVPAPHSFTTPRSGRMPSHTSCSPTPRTAGVGALLKGTATPSAPASRGTAARREGGSKAAQRAVAGRQATARMRRVFQRPSPTPESGAARTHSEPHSAKREATSAGVHAATNVTPKSLGCTGAQAHGDASRRAGRLRVRSESVANKPQAAHGQHIANADTSCAFPGPSRFQPSLRSAAVGKGGAAEGRKTSTARGNIEREEMEENSCTEVRLSPAQCSQTPRTHTAMGGCNEHEGDCRTGTSGTCRGDVATSLSRELVTAAMD